MGEKIIENIIYLDNKDSIYIDKEQIAFLDTFWEGQEDNIATLFALAYIREFYENNLITEDEYELIQNDYSHYIQ